MLRKITRVFDNDDDNTQDEDTSDAPTGNISYLFLQGVKALPRDYDTNWGVRMT